MFNKIIYYFYNYIKNDFYYLDFLQNLMNIDVNNHTYINGLSTHYLIYAKPGTPFLIKYYSENNTCKDYVVYFGTINKVSNTYSSGSYIISSNHNLTKLSYIFNIFSKKNCNEQIYLSNYNFYLRSYDVYTGKNAIDMINKYTLNDNTI